MASRRKVLQYNFGTSLKQQNIHKCWTHTNKMQLNVHAAVACENGSIVDEFDLGKLNFIEPTIVLSV